MTATRVPVADVPVSEAPAGAVDGGNAAFALSFTPVAGSLALYKNGLLQRPGPGNDYTFTGQTITFDLAAVPLAGDSLWADYLR